MTVVKEPAEMDATDPVEVEDIVIRVDGKAEKESSGKCQCKISDWRSLNKDDIWRYLQRLGIFASDLFLLVLVISSPIVAAHSSIYCLWTNTNLWATSFVVFVFSGVVVPCVLTWLACCCCCKRCNTLTYRGKPVAELKPMQYCSSRKISLIIGYTVGLLFTTIYSLVAVYGDGFATRPLRVPADWSTSDPVAVIGSGPSGLSAAWLLAKGGRNVVVFESLDEFGGHSKTWDENSTMNFDLGYIFNNLNAYEEFKLFANSFNHTLVTTALNTSSYYKGQYWDNTFQYAQTHKHGKLEDDVDKFLEFVATPHDSFRMLLPLGLWTWWNGFSEQFLNGPLTAVMSVLFVTKMGMWKQSAQATLDYFKHDQGFCHLRYKQNMVQRGKVGSQYMWRDVVADMNATGRMSMHFRKQATSLEKDDGKWTIKFADGTYYGGFKDIVLAVPGYVSQHLVPGRGLESFLVGQIRYTDAQVTLHRDTNTSLMPMFKDLPNNVEYVISQEPAQMTGFISKIFGYDDNDILLTVHGVDADPLPIAPDKVMWHTTWAHHGFTLWDLYIARRLLPFLGCIDNGGIHYAGDWVYGVGHNDAILGGIAAACAVGVPRVMPSGPHRQLYQNLLQRVCPEDR